MVGKKEGIWTSVLHRNYSCICKLDVGFLNHPNWTSIAQVMVYFSGLPQAAHVLTLYNVHILGLIFNLEKKGIWTSVLYEIISAFANLMEDFESPNLDLYSSSYGPFFGTATSCPILTLYIV